jgi:hypothetical protein
VIAILLLAAVVAQPPCLADAVMRAQSGDVAAALTAIDTARARDCSEAVVAAVYVRGLSAARAAYAQGGSTESLSPVRQAIAELERQGAGAPGPAQIARDVLLAASAAAQSERDEMALWLQEALRLEALQLAAGQAGAPVITAHEAAGDLWLQVHRFDEARDAYEAAAAIVGRTPHIVQALADTAERQQRTRPPDLNAPAGDAR